MTQIVEGAVILTKALRNGSPKSRSVALLGWLMPFYYTLREKAVAAGYVVYMGKDKFENEELLKYGWPEDLWFHVDKLSSGGCHSLS